MFPQRIVVCTEHPSQYTLMLDALAGRKAAGRCLQGAFRLAMEFTEAPAEVVVLDLDGLAASPRELIEALRERSPGVGVVIAAAPEQRDLAGSALCHGADFVLTKPFTCTEVLEAIDRAGRRGRLRDAESAQGISRELLMKFALGIADQVNNPLTTISGWLQILAADRSDDASLAEKLTSVREEADRIAEVVRQLLAAAQHGPPRQDRVDLATVLREIAHSESVKLKDKGIEVTTSIASPLPDVVGDPAQLRQACATLLAESASALNGTGRISIACAAKAQGVQITLKDNGRLMDADLRDRLFEPFGFGRGDTGTGLGLYLARQIVRSHGGTIEVESSEEGGTRFVIWLPATAT